MLSLGVLTRRRELNARTAAITGPIKKIAVQRKNHVSAIDLGITRSSADAFCVVAMFLTQPRLVNTRACPEDFQLRKRSRVGEFVLPRETQRYRVISEKLMRRSLR
jgi:hypothetical protein